MPFEKIPWDNQDRRKSTSNHGLTALKIATRAFEGTPLSGDEMFKDEGGSEKNYVRQSDLKNKPLQNTVNQLLKTANENVEIQNEISKIVDAQYQGALGILTTFNLYNPAKLQKHNEPVVPTLEQAKEILASQITFEQLEVIKKMENPTLQLIPITSMDMYIQALDSNKPMEKQSGTFVSEWSRGAFSRADKRDKSKRDVIIGWKIAITEGKKEPELLKGENVNTALKERNEWFQKEFGKKGISGVDLKRMILLMMKSLQDGKPVNDFLGDGGTWAFVNGEPEYNGLVSGVSWDAYDRRVDLAGNVAVNQGDNARLRASVVVDVPQD